MRLKLLLLFMMLGSVLFSQEPYRGLVITESRHNGQGDNYVELTNMGDKAINLSEFKFGTMRPWATALLDPANDPWIPEGNRFFKLPNVVLQPGQAWVITTAYDFQVTMYNKKIAGFEGNQRPKQTGMYDVADYLVHIKEGRSSEFPSVKDSAWVDPYYRDYAQWAFEAWSGRECYYIEHHFAPGDSAVVDQVGGVFDNNGQNFANSYDVAGVTGATGNSILVRKFSIKTGNLDFANARGVGQDDSEWMPIQWPTGYNAWRDVWWTVGNHGAYILDANTLESEVVQVDYASKTLTVPWGTRRLDHIMRYMKKKPGIAWNYHLNPNREDSLYRGAKTGDKLTIYVVGNTIQTDTFNIVVAPPKADDNMVIPIAQMDITSVRRNGPIVGNTQNGEIGWPRVTMNTSGKDTITGTWHGLPNAQRVDTLLKYLEKPANSTWEIVYSDGVTRPDLKHGDKLKVTSASGKVKEYFIQMQGYQPSHNANLSSITWPDIPEFYKGIYGWVGDTIPTFTPTSYNYRFNVPVDVPGIPALVAKTQSVNAKLEVNRATSLSGSIADRTASFKITAEDDSVTRTYNVEMSRERDFSKLQPYKADPFISEYVWWEQWSNVFLELANPGNQPLDLSDYMIASEDWSLDPAGVITNFSGVDNWNIRYAKYVPGYKWVDESTWAANPGILVQDLAVNSIVQPGDVFVLGAIDTDGQIPWTNTTFRWNVPKQVDVQFYNRNLTNPTRSYLNPWGESVDEWTGNPIRKWNNGSIYLFKILNDSIKLGLKAANDPKDFQLIDVFGMGDGSSWVVGGQQTDMITTYVRKPEIYKGNPVYKGSFGTNWEDSEWIKYDWPYWQLRTNDWPAQITNIGNDVGQHFMYAPTHYMSTVSSTAYKVSEGFSMEEEIRGIVQGTTVSALIGDLIKADEGQDLKVKSASTGAFLGGEAKPSLNDTLVVTSADGSNVSKYVLNVTERGLSQNAILTSDVYFISVDVTTGGIYSIPPGTKLADAVTKVNVPEGATLTVVDKGGAWVPFKTLNFDTTYVDVLVSDAVYFEVVAEDGRTKILYQLVPDYAPSDAYVISNSYSVDQDLNLINFVPRGTEVSVFLKNLIPASGATMKVLDKTGLERTRGALYQDDMLVVTSKDGKVTAVYYLDMLSTQTVTTQYLAFVNSDDFKVDQLNKSISSPVALTPLAQFYAKLTPAFGATMAVYNKDGMPNTTGVLNKGDVLHVTSADGKITVAYALTLDLTSVGQIESGLVSVYPNPTSGKVNISGLEPGSSVKVYNMTGAPVMEILSRTSLETFSLDNQAAGIYFIVVSSNDKVSGTYKVIKN
jgi:hypothetical protein